MRASATWDWPRPSRLKHVLEDGLLLQNVGFGDRQILLVGGHFGLRAYDLDRRQSAELHLLFVVVVQLLRNPQGLTRDLHLRVQAHQIPIQRNHVRHGGDHLLPEGEIGRANIVPRYLDLPVVDREAEALEQRLRYQQVQARSGVRVYVEASGIREREQIVVGERRVRAAAEALRQREVGDLVGGYQRIRAVREQVGLRRGLMAQLMDPCNTGSKFGVVGPSCVITPLELTPLLPTEPLPPVPLPLPPSRKFPPALKAALNRLGTPRSNPPALARSRSDSACKGV